MRRTLAIVAFALASVALFAYSLTPGAKTSWSEALGFITGVLCVWMTVYENVWNFPVGVANSAFFVVLFFKTRLYADLGLNVLYILLGLQGWYLWLYGGNRLLERSSNADTVLRVTRADSRDAWQTALIVLAGVPLLTLYLTRINGAAPFMDSLLTAMSVAAQLLLNRKRLENWLVWIAADIMYIGLYAYKSLYLTAFLYALFTALAVAGYRQWEEERGRPVRGRHPDPRPAPGGLMRRWSHGLVIGKFLPPHRGHKHLIDTAQSHVERLTVIVCDKPEMRPEGALRAEWLREIHPDVDVILIDDRLPADDSRLWAENTRLVLGEAPDVVFTSEDYGEPYARFLGCDHVLVDRERLAVPCSGTLVRSDPLSSLNFLEPCVRAHYAKRVAIVGAESTGTTTLARSLAEACGTAWVEEYGREYWIEKVRRGEQEDWTEDEFVHIAEEQARREDLAARTADRVLFCDTDPFATGLWFERYLGHRSPRVEAVAQGRRYDLTLLTGAEIPFVQDGWRDGEQIRLDMHRRFVERLEEEGRPYTLLIGSPEARLAEAKRLVFGLL